MTTATLETLTARLVEAGCEFTNAANDIMHVNDEHPDDDELIRETGERLLDAQLRFKFVAILHEAEMLKTGDTEWPDGLEARAYLAALKTIVAHIEGVVGGEGA